MSNYSDFMDYLDDYTGRGDAKDYIDARILKANAQISTAETRLTAADTAITQTLVDMQNDQTTFGDDIPGFDVDDPIFDANILKSQVKPEAPTWEPPELEITVIPPEPWNLSGLPAPPDEPQIDPADLTPLTSLEAPNSDEVVGDPPGSEFLFTPVAYVANLADFLQGEIKAAISALETDSGIAVSSHVRLDGSTGGIPLVDNSIEEAVYARAFSRIEVEEAREINHAEKAIQARGFSLPPGALSASISNVRSNTARLLADVNKDVIVSRLELEQKRTEYELKKAEQITDAQFKHDSILVALEEANVKYKEALAQNVGIYIEAGTKLEGILSNIHINEENQRFEAEKETFASTLKLYNLKVDLYKELMQAYLTEVQAAVATIKAETDYNQSLIDIYAGEAQVYNILVGTEKTKVEGFKVNAEVSNMGLMADIEKAKAENERYMALAGEYESEVKAYAALMDGLKTAETLDLTRYDIEAKGKGTEITALTAKATAQIEQAVKMAALSIEALKSQTSISGSIVSAALNAMNTSASFGFGGTAGQSHASSSRKALNIGYSYSGLTEDLEDPETNI